MRKLFGKHTVFIAVLVGTLSTMAGLATAEKPVKVVVPPLEGEFNGGFSPKTLSKTKPTPISFNVSAKLRDMNGDHPPALKQFVLEGDKHASISVKGIPTCKSGQIQATDSKAARKACGPALIGSGKTDVEVQFPEQPPIIAHSELLAFNGGVKGGVTTLYIHAFLTAPVTAAVVTTVKIKKIHKGRYGLESVATIPKIAGGAGSVIFFTLTLKKGILSATCPDGHLNARGTALFSNGTKLAGSVVRPCTPKG
jgi:hypothetical protein